MVTANEKLNCYSANYQTTVRSKIFNITYTSSKKFARGSKRRTVGLRFRKMKLNADWTNGLPSSVVSYRS